MPRTDAYAHTLEHRMADGDNALREEVEKVRDRTRLQALAQGMSPDEADARATQAVTEFCTRWGIKPEMLSPGASRGGRPAPPPRPRGPSAGFFDPGQGAPPPPPPPPPRAVDLGSSPLRSIPDRPDKTQAIKIGDLLRRTQAGNAPAPTPPPAPPVPTIPPGATGPTLSSFLQRVRSRPLPDAPPPTPTPPPLPPPPPPAPPQPRYAPPSPVQIRNVPMHDQVGMGRQAYAPPPPPAPPPVSGAERRRMLLEEFDRTYNEVQSMLEKRIGMEGLALGDLSADPFASGTSPDEVQAIARDLQRLMGGLQQMVSLCQDLMNQLDGCLARGGYSPQDPDGAGGAR